MNKEEIDYWLKLFSDNNYAFMSKDGKKITLFKVFDKLKKLRQENKQLKDNWNIIKQEMLKIRQSTFSKYNSNEWENCLSFNDDILPLIEKMKELEQGSDK